MPTLGVLDYPVTGIDDAIETGKKIAKQFKSQEFDRKTLAAFLGFKSDNTGAFNQKLADLRRYAVIDGRGDSIRATVVAHKLAAPGPKEFEQAVLEMIQNVPLYKALWEHYGDATPSDEDFFATVLNITKADRVQVQEQAPRIRTVFLEGTAKLRGMSPKATGSNGSATPEAPRTHGTPAVGSLEFVAGPIRQSFPFTPEGVELMAKILSEKTFWELLKSLAKKESANPPGPT